LIYYGAVLDTEYFKCYGDIMFLIHRN